jgi:hypothetical protein
MLREEERTRLKFHQHVTLIYRGQLEHQNCIIITKPSEEPAIKKKGRHAIGAALNDVGEGQQQPTSIGDPYAARRNLASSGTTIAFNGRRLTDGA